MRSNYILYFFISIGGILEDRILQHVNMMFCFKSSRNNLMQWNA